MIYSHIIPEFLYKPAYDDKHRAVELTADQGRERYVQKGYREYLLCADCEARFGKYEKYFADLWYQSGRPTHVTMGAHKCVGINYKHFKLFHLSILWRAGASSHVAFKHVKLGAHEPRLRRMLLEDDPGPPSCYPFWGSFLIDPTDNAVLDALVVEPERVKARGHTIYIFTYGGCAWYMFATSHDPGELAPVLFTENGELVLGTQSIHNYKTVMEPFRQFQANAAKRAKPN